MKIQIRANTNVIRFRFRSAAVEPSAGEEDGPTPDPARQKKVDAARARGARAAARGASDDVPTDIAKDTALAGAWLDGFREAAGAEGSGE